MSSTSSASTPMRNAMRHSSSPHGLSPYQSSPYLSSPYAPYVSSTPYASPPQHYASQYSPHVPQYYQRYMPSQPHVWSSNPDPSIRYFPPNVNGSGFNAPDDSIASTASNHAEPFGMANLLRIKRKSSSRPNFAVNLVRELFSKAIRSRSNCSGKCGKEQLDTNIIKQVREAVFNLYPLTYGENEDIAWKKVRNAIDESCRRLNRRPPGPSP